jgi:hypothetical protein
MQNSLMEAKAPGMAGIEPADGDEALEQPPYEARRARILATIEPSYRPAVHFLVPAVLGLGVLVASVWSIRDLRAIELLVVPLTILFGMELEWLMHKHVLHRRIPGLATLYVRHEKQHHVVYTYDDFTMRSLREAKLVLMPAYAVVLVFALDLPLTFLLSRLFGQNVGLLYLTTGMAFFMVYEWLHLAYHLPPDHPIGRLSIIQRMREVHRRHHAPENMKRWNFNVIVPLSDWVRGTLWSPEREAQRRAQRDAERANDAG